MLAPVSVMGATLASFAIYAVHLGLWRTSLLVFLQQNIILGVLIPLFRACLCCHQPDAGRPAARGAGAGAAGAARRTSTGARAEDLVAAHEIQSHLLPRKMPQASRMQIAAAWQPAQEVGGYYIDVLELSGGRLGLRIADVAGKGIGAALLMANLHARFRAFAPEAASPAVLCRKRRIPAFCMPLPLQRMSSR